MEKKRTIKDWVIAMRPWSFPASITPIIVTSAFILWLSEGTEMNINWLNPALSLIMFVLLHASGNLISDYHDHVNGVDKEGSPNGVSWMYDGTFTPKENLHYGYSVIGVVVILGLIILRNSSFDALWLGAVGIFLVCCYPWFKSHARGDVAVLLGFALLPTIGVCYVATGSWHWEAMILSLTYGLMTVAILHANNTRDIENDTGAGLTTLCIASGQKASKVLYLVEVILPYFLIPVCYAMGLVPLWSYITFATLPVTVKNCRQMLALKDDNHQIATLDKQTAQLQMMFGLLLTLSFIIARLLELY